MSDEPFGLSIGRLLVGEESLPQPEASKGVPMPPPAVAPSEKSVRYGKVVLQRERAGRGGKTVTLVSVRPALAPQDLDTLAKKLRKALGCGSHIEENQIVLQGDIADRLQEWFTKQGTRVTGPG